MKFRTRAHYERMLERNSAASVGFTLAAHMVVAAQRGLVDFDADHAAVADVARRLKAEYGEELSTAEVRKEMETARVNPHRPDAIETRDLKDWVSGRPGRGDE